MIGAVASGSRTSPYQGLRSFTEEDAEYFFGRDEERDVVIANLKASRLTVLYGPSGVGKSSLLAAGVMAELAKQAATNQARLESPEFVPVLFREWRDDPSRGIAAAIAAAVTRFTGVEMAPEASLAETIVAAARATDARLFVILDQFEELSLYHGSQTGAGAFPVEFPGLVSDRGLPVNFLVSLREDALAQLDRFRSAIPWMLDTRLQVSPLSDEAAREAVTEPLARFNDLCAPEERVEIEDELVSAVLDQVRTGKVGFEQGGPPDAAQAKGSTDEDRPAPVATPYLQLVMATVWEREISHDPRVLRLATLNALGGAQEIVRTHLDGVLAGLSPEQQELAAKMFDHLVTPSGTKIALRFSDLVKYSGGSDGSVKELLEQLESGEQRILKPIPPPPGVKEPNGAEIFHDVLAPAIVDWGARQHADELKRETNEAEEEASRQRRRARISIALAAIALVLALVAALEYLNANAQRTQANQARATARSRALAAEAITDYQHTLGRGLLLAVQAYKTAPTAQARGALIGGLVKTEGMVAYLNAHAGAVNAVAFDPVEPVLASGSVDGSVVLWNYGTGRRTTLRAVSEPINGVAFSPGGNIVAAASDDGSVNIFDAATGKRLRTLRGNAGQVYGVAFDPARNIVASVNENGSVILWNVATGERLRTLVDPAGEMNGVAFSPSGQTIATADGDGLTMLWNVRSGHRTRTLRTDDTSPVNGVAFSRQGSTIATADTDGLVYLWDARTGQLRHALNDGDGAAIESVAFSPKGQTVVAGGADNDLRTWNATTGDLLRTFQGQTAAVESVAFSPDGNMMASGSADESVILWDVTPVGGTTTLDAHKGRVYSVAFGAGGRTLAAANGNGTVSLWDVGTRRELRVLRPRMGAVESVAFATSGKELAAVGNDGSVVVWDTATGRLRLSRSDGGDGDALNSVAFSPSGNLLAAASDFGSVFLWNVPTGRLLYKLHRQAGVIHAVTFASGGTMLASAGADGTIVLWDPRTGRYLRTLVGLGDPVEGVAFSPVDGALLASASDDDTVTLWNAATGQQLGATLQGHQAQVYTVAFSPDGRTLASGSVDHTVIVWNLATRLAEPLGGHADNVNSVAYSPDGSLLASGSADGTIILYASVPRVKSPARIYRSLCGVVRSNFTHPEWTVFLGGIDYEKTCPSYPVPTTP